MERTKWDDRFGGSEYHYGTNVNEWIRRGVERFFPTPEGLHACELAAGEGRNAVWLAQQGFEVTAFDRSIEGLQKAHRLAERRNVHISTRHDDIFQFANEASGWQEVADLVISSFFHMPQEEKQRLLEIHRFFLRPGGYVIAEWFHPDQRRKGYSSGGPPEPSMLFTPAELREHFADWRIIDCAYQTRVLDEGRGHTGPAAVTQMVVQRPL